MSPAAYTWDMLSNKRSWIPWSVTSACKVKIPYGKAGTDHAGIATQMVVERKIAAEEGKTRQDYGRDAFIDKIWQWKAESGGNIPIRCAVSVTLWIGT